MTNLNTVKWVWHSPTCTSAAFHLCLYYVDRKHCFRCCFDRCKSWAVALWIWSAMSLPSNAREVWRLALKTCLMRVWAVLKWQCEIPQRYPPVSPKRQRSSENDMPAASLTVNNFACVWVRFLFFLFVCFSKRQIAHISKASGGTHHTALSGVVRCRGLAARLQRSLGERCAKSICLTCDFGGTVPRYSIFHGWMQSCGIFLICFHFLISSVHQQGHRE